MPTSTQATIAVLGSGSWGTALALLFARNGCEVRLWGLEAEAILQEGENARYLPGVPLTELITVSPSLASAVHGADGVLLAVPSVAFPEIAAKVKDTGHVDKIAWATKGLDHDKSQLLSVSLVSIWPELQSKAVLSGPSFAGEVAAQMPSAVNVASDDIDYAEFWCQCLNNDYFHAKPADDIVGVQLGGAVKNVIAIAAGMVDGLGFGANARCALITRGLSEMCALGQAMGARLETFMDLAGIGDLMLTATDNQSRNRRFGLALGGGESIDQAEASIGQVVEGKITALCVQEMAAQYGVEMPLVNHLVAILKGDQQLDKKHMLWFLSE